MLRAVVVAFLFSTSVAVSAEPLEAPQELRAAAPDETGRVWACRVTSEDSLLVHDGNSWTTHEFNPGDGPGWKPQALAALRDGSVLCVWQGSREMRLSRHRDGESKLWAKCDGVIGSSSNRPIGVSEDRGGNIWLTEIGPNIYRFAPDGSGGLVYTVPPNTVLPERPSPRYPLSITEDPRGELWIWATSWGTPGTMVRYAQNQFEVISTVLPEDRPKQAPFLSVEPKDSNTLWVATINFGLGEFDLNTLKCRRTEFPGNKNTIGSAAAIFEDRDVWYFVVNNPVRKLWRYKEGQWSEVGEALGGWRDRRVDRRCIVVKTKRGILIDDEGSLFRFADMEKPPEIFDWRSGFNLRELSNLYVLPDDRIFALATNGRYFLGELKSVKDQADQRIRVMNNAFLWRPDASGKMWATLERNTTMLSCWEGSAWRQYAIPEKVQAAYCSDLAFDANGCIWLLPDSNELPVGILDPRTSTWRVFPKIEDAISAGYVAFPDTEGRPYVPAWSSDRMQAAFRDLKKQNIGYFDGRSWKRLSTDGIGPNGQAGSGLPFFDKKDRLCVHVRENTFAYLGAKWTKIEWQPGPPDDLRGSQVVKERPPGPSLSAKDSAVRDNLGAWWILRNGSLAKVWENQTVPVFDEGEANPMGDGRKIYSVFVDQAGTAFLKTTFGTVQIEPREPVGDTMVRVEKSSPYMVVLHAEVPNGEVLRWRVDGGAWNYSEKPIIEISDLPAGEHIAEVASVNRDLIPDLTPAKVSFALTYQTKDRVNELIKVLSDKDYAKREEALRALIRNGKGALPQLKAAAETADDPWWINAAIQQIEREQED